MRVEAAASALDTGPDFRSDRGLNVAVRKVAMHDEEMIEIQQRTFTVVICLGGGDPGSRSETTSLTYERKASPTDAKKIA